MKRRVVLASLATAAATWSVPTSAKEALPPVQVFKNPSRDCCGAWVEHIKTAGFAVDVTTVHDTSGARKRYGLPVQFGSCHTAVVPGYVVEGHVPPNDVRKLLAISRSAS
jgi:hypothetical protein